MGRTVTLSQLRTDIANQADIVTSSAGRYTDALLNRLINQSIQRFRERISTDGLRHYLVHTTGTLGTGATSPFPFYALDLSAVSPGIVRVFGVDITVNSEVRTLQHAPFEARADYLQKGGGIPVAWAEYQTDKIAILPASSSAYSYVVWYLPVATDLAADGDTFDGKAGWEDYIVWDVVCRLITRDNYASQYQLARDQRDALWRDILRNATRVTDAGGARIGRDSYGERRSGFAKSALPDA